MCKELDLNEIAFKPIKIYFYDRAVDRAADVSLYNEQNKASGYAIIEIVTITKLNKDCNNKN